MNQWTGKDVEQMLINPAYAIVIHRDLAGDHERLISKKQWIDANVRLIDQLGAKVWLQKLVAVLEGDFPRQSQAPPDPDGQPADTEI